MAKCRSIFVFGLVVFWTAMPALACLPTGDMTQAEMDCCKKMVGDCHMGPQHHPCCDMRLNAAPHVAAMTKDSRLPLRPAVVVVMVSATAEFVATSDRHTSYAQQGLPPPAPPGLHSILRI